jgi:hypothetical protein
MQIKAIRGTAQPGCETGVLQVALSLLTLLTPRQVLLLPLPFRCSFGSEAGGRRRFFSCLDVVQYRPDTIPRTGDRAFGRRGIGLYPQRGQSMLATGMCL